MWWSWVVFCTFTQLLVLYLGAKTHFNEWLALKILRGLVKLKKNQNPSKNWISRQHPPSMYKKNTQKNPSWRLTNPPSSEFLQAGAMNQMTALLSRRRIHNSNHRCLRSGTLPFDPRGSQQWVIGEKTVCVYEPWIPEREEPASSYATAQ